MAEAEQRKELHEWLVAALGRLKLEDETLVDYVESILQEDSYAAHEKQDVILEFLSASTGEDLKEFGEELMVRWGAVEAAREAIKKLKQQEEAERQKARQLELQKQNEEREKLAKQRAAEQKMSKEERQKRRELLERYGYQIETTDENGDIVLTENVCDAQDAGLGMEQNDNASRVAQEAQAQREKAREKHQQKVARDKEALLKQQLEKEKRKKKTEKREKRRL